MCSVTCGPLWPVPGWLSWGQRELGPALGRSSRCCAIGAAGRVLVNPRGPGLGQAPLPRHRNVYGGQRLLLSAPRGESRCPAAATCSVAWAGTAQKWGSCGDRNRPVSGSWDTLVAWHCPGPRWARRGPAPRQRAWPWGVSWGRGGTETPQPQTWAWPRTPSPAPSFLSCLISQNRGSHCAQHVHTESVMAPHAPPTEAPHSWVLITSDTRVLLNTLCPPSACPVQRASALVRGSGSPSLLLGFPPSPTPSSPSTEARAPAPGPQGGSNAALALGLRLDSHSGLRPDCPRSPGRGPQSLCAGPSRWAPVHPTRPPSRPRPPPLCKPPPPSPSPPPPAGWRVPRGRDQPPPPVCRGGPGP